MMMAAALMFLRVYSMFSLFLSFLVVCGLFIDSPIILFGSKDFCFYEF